MRFLKSKEDVLTAIRNRSKEIEASMTDAQFFQSDAFFKFAEGLVSILLKPHRQFRLTITHQEETDGPVAYTDGNKIFINTGNPIARNTEHLQNRFSVNMGILFHECAHKLFLNFPGERKAEKKLRSGSLYGEEPVYADPACIQALEEIKKALADPAYNEIIVGLFMNLSNIVADGHDEFIMKQAYPGYVAKCIDAAGQAQFEQARLLEDLASDLNVPKFSVYFDLILFYAKLGKFKYEQETPAVQEYLDGIEKIMPNIDIALNTEDPKVKFSNLTSILVFLWDYIRQLLQNSGSTSQSGSSGAQGASGGGNASGSQDPFGGNTPQQVSQTIQNAIDQATPNTTAPAPVNCSHKAITPSKGNSQNGTDPAAMQSQIVNKAASDIATQDVQNSMDQAMRDYLRNVVSSGDWGHVSVQINRYHECSNPGRYSSIVQEVGPYASNTAKAMKRALQEYSWSGTKKHQLYGSKIRAQDAYRKDQRFFARSHAPSDIPDLAIAVLCDESGSMTTDGREDAARKAMVLLERFATEMSIPSMFAGHRLSYGDQVVLEVYSDFTSAMAEQDRQCIADISPGGCNHDGIPIRMVGQWLAERPEQIKLFFVISDGTPNGIANYEGKKAIKDIQKAIADLSKRGVIVYGAAIGDDKETIEEIYGKGFLDLTDLAQMPRTMVRIVKSKLGLY